MPPIQPLTGGVAGQGGLPTVEAIAPPVAPGRPARGAEPFLGGEDEGDGLAVGVGAGGDDDVVVDDVVVVGVVVVGVVGGVVGGHGIASE